MTTAQLIIVCLTVVLLVAIPAGIVYERDKRIADFEPVALEGLAPTLGARVVVHKLDGQALQGELVAQDAFGVKLDQVELLSDGVSSSVAGSWYIAAERIDSLQEM